MRIQNWRKEIFTIPNLLSLFRLVLIPVYVTIYLNARDAMDYYIAAGILAVSCLTDLIDGQIARHFNMISTVGKILDPLADKITQFTLIVCLTIKHSVLWIIVCLFVIKESFQLVAGSINLRKGKMLKGALIPGKICTAVLFISLIIMVMVPVLPDTAVNVIVILDTVFLLVSFLSYVIAYFKDGSKFQTLN
ncbi:MAG: CDP-alcohol phosphatidyltransferase family protein [Oscillospiraceae bacterium]|nr:CDP-alcohol phosphatidyltransferase family protein [Oscillospiraceae bacterium]